MSSNTRLGLCLPRSLQPNASLHPERLSLLPGLPAYANYAVKVLSYGPIAYWPLWEAAGLTAQDQVNSPAQDGTYIGPPALGQPGIGDGNTSPYFDGVNDLVDVYSVAFAGAFDGSEGSLIAWARVLNAGIWTDGNFHRVCTFHADANNQIGLFKRNLNNQFYWQYIAGGTTDFVLHTTISEVAWMCIGMTWSLSAGATGEMRAYLNGAQHDPTQTGLGTWVGALLNTNTVIGSYTNGPIVPWDGWIAHTQLYDYPLPPTDMANLAVVP